MPARKGISVTDFPSRLTFIRKGRPRYVWCQCVCGAEKEILKQSFDENRTRSCGCLQRELTHLRSVTHGKTNAPIYGVWEAAKGRTGNPKDNYYGDYGGRGITMCQRWQGFDAFYVDMGDPPTPKHQIDRIDNDKGYWCGHPDCPECGPLNREPNCRWATVGQQARNRRNNRRVSHQGRTQCLVDWASEVGISAATLAMRLKLGWSVEQTLTTPLHAERR